MEEDFYKVWTVEQYNQQPRGEGWLIMGDSHWMEDGPATAGDEEEAAVEWGRRHMRGVDGPDEVSVVVVDGAGEISGWVLTRRVRVEIDAEPDDGDSGVDDAP